MLVILVHVQVKADCIEAFKAATLENARQSVQEPGIARFDVLQQAEQPDQFVLVEAYRTADAPGQHKATAHYAKWRDTVESMMAGPRKGMRHNAVFPDDSRF
jgi:quinol monooxygenase YgiN